MNYTPLIDNLIDALCCLPGVGPKSAQRMAFYLLERDKDGGKRLAERLTTAIENIRHCMQCRNFCETDICHICQNPKRDKQLLCIVETPADVLAIEQTHSYRGLYFVLMGHLSPLDGIRPENLGIELLKERLVNHEFEEVILATNPTVEGEATAHYLANLIKEFVIKTSRIAHGVPLGGELEFVDGGTLARAVNKRELLE